MFRVLTYITMSTTISQKSTYLIDLQTSTVGEKRVDEAFVQVAAVISLWFLKCFNLIF